MRLLQPVINSQLFDQDITAYANTNAIQSPTNYLIATSLSNRLTYILQKKQVPPIWNLLYTWECSIGKPSTPTPVGTFAVIGHRPNFGSTTYQVKYATRFKPAYYYHSILFDGYAEKVIDGRLGIAISNGCIRLAVDNAKWLYDNVPNGTPVIIS